MVKYSNTLEVAYNILADARLQVLNEVPQPEDIIRGLSQADILRRDAWIFMVRKQGILQPYFFDAVRRKVLPLGVGGGERATFSTTVGNGLDQEFIIRHDLGDTNVTATAWKPSGDRMYRVECEVFQLLDSNNHIGVAFCDPPGVDEFIVSVS